MKVVFLSLLLLAATFLVEARRCYKCTSTNEGPCFDPGDKNATAEACVPSSEEFSCSTTRIIQGSNGDVIIKRDCLRAMLTDQFCAEFEEEGVQGQNKYLMGECTVCDKDLCNSSTKITPLILVAPLIWSLLLYKLI